MKTLLLLLLPTAACAQLPRLLASVGGSAAAGTFTTSAIDTTGANFLAACVTAQTIAFSDPPYNNTWTAITPQTNNHTTQLFVALNPTVGPGHTFQQTGASTFGSLVAAAYLGVASVDGPAQNGTNAGGGFTQTFAATGSVTPAAGRELLLTCMGTEGTGTFSIDSGFQILKSVPFVSGNSYGSAMAYRVQNAAAAVNPTWSYSTATRITATIAAFGTQGNVFSSSGAGVYLPPVWVKPAPVAVSAEHIASPSGGDTQQCAWVSASVRSGSWGGGSIVCAYNDGSGFGCGSSSICLYQLLTYDKALISNTTFGLVNSMTSYGVSGAAGAYDQSHGAQTMKSRRPFSLPGLLFLPIESLSLSTWNGLQSGFIVSPDGGAHFCNLKSYLAHASGHNCDATNWQAGGDNPVDAAGFQWPLADGTSKMTRLMIVDMLCQDNTTACPVAKGVDPAYLYGIMTDNSNNAYVVRVLKSLGIRIMEPGNWQAYQTGSWTSTVQNATDVGGGVLSPLCCSSFAYLKDFGVFVSWQHAGTASMPFAIAPAPWGPWTAQAPIALPDNGYQFPSPLPGLCPKYDTVGRVTCTTLSNDASGLELYLREHDLGPGRQVFSSVH